MYSLTAQAYSCISIYRFSEIMIGEAFSRLRCHLAACMKNFYHLSCFIALPYVISSPTQLRKCSGLQKLKQSCSSDEICPACASSAPLYQDYNNVFSSRSPVFNSGGVYHQDKSDLRVLNDVVVISVERTTARQASALP